MIKYLKIKIKDISDEEIDSKYLYLLDSKVNFLVIDYNNENYILTKEKSLFKVDSLEEFINNANDDVYYSSIICDKNEYLKDDLNIYYKYLRKFKKDIEKKYGNKYLFGCVAVKTINENIITTIRGKKNLNEFTIVSGIKDNKIYVSDKKASLNAPLLYKLLENKNVKFIVHINHKYDDRFVYLDYAFPGTVKDTEREISRSFNIANHGVFILFDNEWKEIM